MYLNFLSRDKADPSRTNINGSIKIPNIKDTEVLDGIKGIFNAHIKADFDYIALYLDNDDDESYNEKGSMYILIPNKTEHCKFLITSIWNRIIDVGSKRRFLTSFVKNHTNMNNRFDNYYDRTIFIDNFSIGIEECPSNYKDTYGAIDCLIKKEEDFIIKIPDSEEVYYSNEEGNQIYSISEEHGEKLGMDLSLIKEETEWDTWRLTHDPSKASREDLYRGEEVLIENTKKDFTSHIFLVPYIYGKMSESSSSTIVMKNLNNEIIEVELERKPENMFDLSDILYGLLD